MANLPNYNHKFNYNARAFDSSTGTFTNIGGSLSDLVLYKPSIGNWTASTDYVTVSACSSQVYTVPEMDSPSAMTVVMKGYPVKGGGDSQYNYANFLAHRTSNNMNYMLRAFDNGGNGTNASAYWHLGNDSSSYASGGTCPEVFVWRHSGSTWEAKLYNEGTSVTRNGSYGSNSGKFIFFAGYTDFTTSPNSTYNENWYGDFYWTYGTTDYLSDSDIAQVVDFNEHYATYDTKTSEFPASGGTDSYSLWTEASWNAVSDSLWVSVSPASGTGDSTLTITVGRNSGSADRTGTVTVTDANDNVLLVWSVEQGYRATPIMNIIYNNSTW